MTDSPIKFTLLSDKNKQPNKLLTKLISGIDKDNQLIRKNPKQPYELIATTVGINHIHDLPSITSSLTSHDCIHLGEVYKHLPENGQSSKIIATKASTAEKYKNWICQKPSNRINPTCTIGVLDIDFNDTNPLANFNPFIDSDNNFHPIEFIVFLRCLIPELNNVAFTAIPSTTSNISRSDTGEKITFNNKYHIYFAIAGELFIPFKKVLENALLNVGGMSGMVHLGKNNYQRYIVDMATFKTRALAYEAPPVILDGNLIQNRCEPTLIPALDNCTGDILTSLPSLPELQNANKHYHSQFKPLEGYSDNIVVSTKKVIGKHTTQLGNVQDHTSKKKLTLDDFKIASGGNYQTSKLNLDDILYLAKDKPVKVRKIFNSPNDYIGKQFCFPTEENYHDYELNTYFNYNPKNGNLNFFSLGHSNVFFTINPFEKFDIGDLKIIENVRDLVKINGNHYIDDKLFHAMKDNLCNVLHYDKGTGKNFNIIMKALEFFAGLHCKITIVVPTITLARFIESDLKKNPLFKDIVLHYKEITGLNKEQATDYLIFGDILITTPNSIMNHNVIRHVDKSDVIIFDECISSIFNSVLTGTIKKTDQEVFFDYIVQLIQEKKTYHLSSDVDHLYLEFISNLGIEVNYYHASEESRKNVKKDRRVNWVSSQNETLKMFYDCLKNGGSAIFVSDSKKDCKIAHDYVKKEMPWLKGDLITGDNSNCDKTFEFLDNINEEVKKLDYLIFNTALSVGVSINVKHFTKLYGIYNKIVNYQDFEQAISRNRPKIDMFLSSPNDGNEIKNARDLYETALKDIYYKHREETTTIDDSLPHGSMICPYIKPKLTLFDTLRLRVLANNITYKSKDLLIHSLESVGYKIIYRKSTLNAEQKIDLNERVKEKRKKFNEDEVKAIVDNVVIDVDLKEIGSMAEKAITLNKLGGNPLSNKDNACIIQSAYGLTSLEKYHVQYYNQSGLYQVRKLELLLLKKERARNLAQNEILELPISLRKFVFLFWTLGQSLLKYSSITIVNSEFVFNDDFILTAGGLSNFLKWFERNNKNILLTFPNAKISKKPHVMLKNLLSDIGFMSSMQDIKIKNVSTNGMKTERVYRFTTLDNQFLIDVVKFRSSLGKQDV